jgi:hypothetical protein
MCKSFTGLYIPEKTMWRYSKAKKICGSDTYTIMDLNFITFVRLQGA